MAALAVLARIDAIALVALLAAIQLWRGSRRHLGVATLAFVVVLAPWWLWCTATFGTPIPTSGSAVHELAPFGAFSRETMTLAAGAVAGGPFGVWNRVRAELVDHWMVGAALFWVFVAGSAAVTVAMLRRRDRSDRSGAWMFAPALPAFAGCLLAFYAWFGVTWFFTRYLVPVAWVLAVLIGVGAAPLARRSRPVALRVAVVALVAVGLIAAVRVDVGWMGARHRPSVAGGAIGSYDALTGYREPVRRILRSVPPGSTLAGWQSGALGYFGTDRTVINLDGAVNPDVAGASNAQRARYLRRRHADGIADFGLVVLRLASGLVRLRPPPDVKTAVSVPAGGVLPPYIYATVRWPARPPHSR